VPVPHDDRPTPTTAAVVLAAGAGSRFAGNHHKLRTPVKGKPLVRHAVDAAREAGFDEVIVVEGAVELVDVLPDDVTVLRNDSWEQGMATSLHAAIRYAEMRRHHAVVVGLGDQPAVEPATWVALREAESDLASAEFRGDWRPPVRLASAMWASLPVSGDEGARALLRQRPEMVESVPCQGDPADVDTVEDLRRWT